MPGFGLGVALSLTLLVAMAVPYRTAPFSGPNGVLSTMAAMWPFLIPAIGSGRLRPALLRNMNRVTARLPPSPIFIRFERRLLGSVIVRQRFIRFAVGIGFVSA